MKWLRIVRKFVFAAVMVAAAFAMSSTPIPVQAQGFGQCQAGEPPCTEPTESCCYDICEWAAEVCEQLCLGTWVGDCYFAWDPGTESCDFGDELYCDQS
jgi:hypothetical protein